jgi:hypothetical protein
MSTPLTDRITALTASANATTGASDTTLTDAVGTLIAGFGGGKPSFVNNFEFGSFTVPEESSTHVLTLQGDYATYPKGIIIFSNAFDLTSAKADKPMLGAFAAAFFSGTPAVPLSSYNNYILSYYSTYCVNWESGSPGARPTWRLSKGESRGLYFYEPSTKALNLRGFGTGEYDFKQGIEYHYLVWD